VKIITTIGLSHTSEATNYYTFIVRKSCNAIFCVGQENDDLALFPSLSLYFNICAASFDTIFYMVLSSYQIGSG